MMFANGVTGATVDRLYRLGDDTLPGNIEDGTAGQPVGSGSSNVSPGNTIDGIGPSGAFQDLAPQGSPVYIDVSTTGPNLASARPGATAGELGILFDGNNDHLTGANLNNPSLSAASMNSGGPLDYGGIDDRGFQLWVYPHSASNGTFQDVVMDSTEHGVSITAGGTWSMRFAGADSDSTFPVAFDQWTHVMVAKPNGSRSFMYINGVAVGVLGRTYDDSSSLLVVGSNSGETPGSSNYFDGVLDDMTMFVMGTSDMGTPYGGFNLGNDNDFVAQQLTGVAGDVNLDGVLNSQDVDDLVAGWENVNTVNEVVVGPVAVGDLNSYAKGDLNFDGRTNLRDVFLLHDALANANLGGFNFSLLNGVPVPEPHSMTLFALGLSLFGVVNRHRRGEMSIRKVRHFAQQCKGQGAAPCIDNSECRTS